VKIIKVENQILKSFIPVVKGLAKTLGQHYEIVLHDISETKSSVIAIENGHITGREVGAPATDFLFEVINSKKSSEQNMILNYVSEIEDEIKMKSSTMLIRDENEKIIGALCINFDLTSVNIAKNFLEDISFIEENDSKEKFPENVDRFLEIMIEKAISIVNKPINVLAKEDKIRIVKYLHENNVFDIKGSVQIVANHLNVSKYSIYNYLEEIRIDSRMK